MALTTSNMGLKQWDQPNDIFSYTDLANNFGLIDQHDHSSGKGVQIQNGGIANLAIGTSKIADGAITGTKLASTSVAESNLTATAAAKLTPSFVTSLPGSPFDGQEIYYQADATNGVIWHLRYRTGSSSIYKWEFVGGAQLASAIVTEETTSSNTWTDLTTVGPSLTAPLAGDYEFQISSSLGSTGTSVEARLGVGVNSFNPNAGAGSAMNFYAQSVTVPATINQYGLLIYTFNQTLTTAASALKMRYMLMATVSVKFSNRRLRICPIRVG